MNSPGNRYAVVIELSEGLLAESLGAWERLAGMGIDYISRRSACPHIAMIWGECKEPERLKEALGGMAGTLEPFALRANGLGVYVRETPVVHVRWLRSKGLTDLHHLLLERLGGRFDGMDAGASVEMWEPKATLAFSDITYGRLGSVLGELGSFDFEKEMRCTGLSLVAFSSEGEKTLERFDFGKPPGGGP